MAARGGEIRMKSGIKTIDLNPDGSVARYQLLSGEALEADLYVSAMPVDIVKKLLPESWYRMDFFRYCCGQRDGRGVAEGGVAPRRALLPQAAASCRHASSMLTPRAFCFPPRLAGCRRLDKLVGVPVINIHIWFDRKLSTGTHAPAPWRWHWPCPAVSCRPWPAR